jgi:hypothetical protein
MTYLDYRLALQKYEVGFQDLSFFDWAISTGESLNILMRDDLISAKFWKSKN